MMCDSYVKYQIRAHRQSQFYYQEHSKIVMACRKGDHLAIGKVLVPCFHHLALPGSLLKHAILKHFWVRLRSCDTTQKQPVGKSSFGLRAKIQIFATPYVPIRGIYALWARIGSPICGMAVPFVGERGFDGEMWGAKSGMKQEYQCPQETESWRHNHMS